MISWSFTQVKPLYDVITHCDILSTLWSVLVTVTMVFFFFSVISKSSYSRWSWRKTSNCGNQAYAESEPLALNCVILVNIVFIYFVLLKSTVAFIEISTFVKQKIVFVVKWSSLSAHVSSPFWYGVNEACIASHQAGLENSTLEAVAVVASTLH